jgi:hypothetical protein
MRTVRRQEQGKPAAALAIIATIFAAAVAIKLLPPATRDARLPVTQPTLPSRALLIWSSPERVSAARVPILPPRPVRHIAQREDEAATSDIPPIFENLPGDAPTQVEAPVPNEAPLLASRGLIPVAPLMTAAAEPAETEIGSSPLVSAVTKTGSALRLAFVKAGHGIKAAASGTAGVFVSNP